MSLNVNIEELVLEGLTAGQETAVLAALEAELARLFGETLPTNHPVADPIAVPPITVAPNAEPYAIAQQIGQAIYGAVIHA